MGEAAAKSGRSVARGGSSWTEHLPVGFLFLVSGATGLLYEVLWSRQFVLVLGGSYPAVVAVVTAFLGGLAGGAALGGRWASRVRRPLRAYGILEAVIALYCALLPTLLEVLHPLFGVLYRSLGGSPGLHGAARFAAAALLLMPPTLAMGATLPFLVRHVVRGTEGLVGGVGLLYGLNTVGAAGGALLTGLLVLPALGLHGTLMAGVTANLVVAAVAVLLDRRSAGIEPSARETEEEPPTPSARDTAPLRDRRLERSLLLLAAGSGFAAMVDQMGWTRALILFLGSSTHAFTLIVSAFILGLGLGGLLAPALCARGRRLPVVLAVLQVVIGLSAWAGLWLLIDLPVAWVEAMPSLAGDWTAIMWWEFGRVLLVVLLPTLAMGVTFPVLVAALSRCADGASRSVGRVYAWNTAGTLLGAVGGGMLLVPALGIRGALLAAVVVNLALAALVASSALAGRRGRGAALTCLAVAALLVWAAPAWPVHRLQSGTFTYWEDIGRRAETGHRSIDRALRDELWDLLYHREGRTATVSVVRWEDGSVFLRVNGKTDAGTGDMATQLNLGHVPAMAMPGARSGLVIGLATGVSAAALESHGLERTDVVEISPEVLEASAQFASINDDLPHRPGVRILLEDGRTHIDHAQERYDVIVSEPTNPWIAGVSNLFTEEYFRACRRRLTDDGVVGIWVQAYGISADDFRMICRTFQEVFPDATLWELVPWVDYMLVASRDDAADILGRIAAREMPGERARASLAEGGIGTTADLLSHVMCGPRGLAQFAGEGPLHTDDLLQLEFNTPRGVARDRSYRTISAADLDAARDPSEALARVTGDARRRLETQLEAGRLSRLGYGLTLALQDDGTHRMLLDEMRSDPALREGIESELPPSVKPRITAWLDDTARVVPAREDLVHFNMACAIHRMQACLDLSPQQRWTAEMLANALSHRSRQLLEEGAFADGEADLLRAMALVPSSARPPYRLGLARLTASGGDAQSPLLPRALEAFDRALVANENHEEALAQRAVCLSLMGRTGEAEEAFLDGLARRSDSVHLMFHFAMHLVRQGRLDEAWDRAREARGLQPGFPGLADLAAALEAGR